MPPLLPAFVAALVQMAVMAMVEVQAFNNLRSVKAACQSATALILRARMLLLHFLNLSPLAGFPVNPALFPLQ